jgi:hypothetical protein
VIQSWVPAPLDNVLIWVHLHQTLIAGLIAFAGAMLTVQAIRDQIGQSQRQADDQLDRTARSVLALLPHELSQVDEYCSRCKCYYEDEAKRHEGKVVSDAPAPPEFPYKSIRLIADAIRYVPKNDGVRIGEAIQFAQVQRSRFAGVLGERQHGIFRNTLQDRRSQLAVT